MDKKKVGALTFKINVTVFKYHLIWAAYMLICGYPEKRLTKKAVVQYLRNQLEQFGSDDESLMGIHANIEFLYDVSNPELKKAREFIQKRFSNLNKQ